MSPPDRGTRGLLPASTVAFLARFDLTGCRRAESSRDGQATGLVCHMLRLLSGKRLTKRIVTCVRCARYAVPVTVLVCRASERSLIARSQRRP
jgi:hypothetical protein